MASGTLLNRFLESFVLPLVAGGRVEVRGLLGPGVVEHFASDPQLDGTLVAEITRHARMHLSKIGPLCATEVIPRDAIVLAAVWHNLLAMTHPDVAPRARLRRRVREWCESMLEWVGPPRTAAEVAARHGLLARLSEVGRVDTDVTFWAGSARYIGVAPPARLVAWRTLRRVRETKTRVSFYELLRALEWPEPSATENLVDVMRAALALSPLTDVALVDRSSPADFEWTPPAVNALGDVALRSAAARLVLTRATTSLTAGDDASAARVRAVEAATLRAVNQGAPQSAAQLLLAFHLEMLVSEGLGRGDAAPDGHALAWDALGRLGIARAARIVGIDRARFQRALGLDMQSRGPLKDAPSAPLLARAGFAEVSS